MEFRTYGFETILNGLNGCPYCGGEKLVKISDKIFVYIDKFGSHRFVYKNGPKNISALQIMVRGEIKQVANVITVEKHRRKGLATILFNEAKNFFKSDILHSDSLNDFSRNWIKSL